MTIRKSARTWLLERLGGIDGKLFASRLYPPAQSWTGDYAWWIQVPLSAIANDQPLHFVLEQREGSFLHLQVPSSFIREHQREFKVVNGTHIHLFLSATVEELTDLRGPGKLPFREFKSPAPISGKPSAPSAAPNGSRLTTLTSRQLLGLYQDLMAELRERGTIRSSNNPVADYAELLAARALELSLEPRSTTGFDGTDRKGRRYEIKGRRRTSHNQSTQLSQIRGLGDGHFDFLVGVIFKPDFSVDYAAVIPHAVVVETARFRAHVNASIFHFAPDVLDDSRVRDITEAIDRASRALDSRAV